MYRIPWFGEDHIAGGAWVDQAKPGLRGDVFKVIIFGVRSIYQQVPDDGMEQGQEV